MCAEGARQSQAPRNAMLRRGALERSRNRAAGRGGGTRTCFSASQTRTQSTDSFCGPLNACTSLCARLAGTAEAGVSVAADLDADTGADAGGEQLCAEEPAGAVAETEADESVSSSRHHSWASPAGSQWSTPRQSSCMDSGLKLYRKATRVPGELGAGPGPGVWSDAGCAGSALRPLALVPVREPDERAVCAARNDGSTTSGCAGRDMAVAVVVAVAVAVAGDLLGARCRLLTTRGEESAGGGGGRAETAMMWWCRLSRRTIWCVVAPRLKAG